MAFRNGFDNQLEGFNIVRCMKCICILKVNLMLCRCNFMMGCLDFKSHILKGQDHITSCIFTKVNRTKIKITAFFMGFCRRHTVIICMEKEEFQFRTDIECIAHRICLFDHFL